MLERHINEGSSVDVRVLRSVAETLGMSRLAELLVIFEARIEWLEAALGALPADFGVLLHVLHQSRGSAASVGFNRLNKILAEVEQGLRLGAPNSGQLPSKIVARETDTPELGKPELGKPRGALGMAWQSSLETAAAYVPELNSYRPFGSKR